MKVNVGSVDRLVRVSVGVLLVGLAATGTIGVWGYIGVLPILTGAFGVCPAYSLFGIDTCPNKSR